MVRNFTFFRFFVLKYSYYSWVKKGAFFCLIISTAKTLQALSSQAMHLIFSFTKKWTWIKKGGNAQWKSESNDSNFFLKKISIFQTIITNSNSHILYLIHHGRDLYLKDLCACPKVLIIKFDHIIFLKNVLMVKIKRYFYDDQKCKFRIFLNFLFFFKKTIQKKNIFCWVWRKIFGLMLRSKNILV